MRPAILSLDWYYRDLAAIELAGRGRRNFDEPAALDSALLIEHVARLAGGETIGAPDYDFARHARTERTIPIAPGRAVIIEGLFTFHWEPVRARLDARIYIEANADLRLERRLDRDVVERGRTPESVHRQWQETVVPMYRRYVEPQRAYATLIVDGAAPIAESVRRIRSHIAPALGG
jgi:uridine kinase